MTSPDSSAGSAVRGSDAGMIRAERSGSVVVVTLDNPPQRNAMDRHAMRAVADQVAAASQDQGVRAVVITGGPQTFCAGAQLTPIGIGGPEEDPATHVMADVTAMITAVTGASVPVIAAVDGAAAGVGASLAFACDLIVAGEKAFFLLPFGKIALIPDGAAITTAIASLGRHRAMSLALLQERLPAAEAAQAGLVTAVVGPGEALERALEIARGFSGSSRRALAETKALVNRAGIAGIEESLSWETRVQSELLAADEHREGVAAFLERRPPVYDKPAD